jgi:mitochondrial cardiolipin hydrolase
MPNVSPHNPTTTTIGLADGARFRAVFSRTESVAESIERQIQSAGISLDAALHRFNSRRLGAALAEASRRGVRVRLVLDESKFEASLSTQKLVAKHSFPFRLSSGQDGGETKMHHKFLLVDRETVLTGSYNWTLASEEQNHENVMIVHDGGLAGLYADEFEALWQMAGEQYDGAAAERKQFSPELLKRCGAGF